MAGKSIKKCYVVFPILHLLIYLETNKHQMQPKPTAVQFMTLNP